MKSQTQLTAFIQFSELLVSLIGKNVFRIQYLLLIINSIFFMLPSYSNNKTHEETYS